MDELTKLAVKYKTDKWGKHHYTPVYFDLFKDQTNEVKKVLEIGPAEGAGLFMFRDFFPNATIYGAEIDQNRVDKLQGLDRIQVFKCDQANKKDLKQLIDKIGADIDVIVDDGSHKLADQVNSCHTLLPLVNKGCIYIIEDVADLRVKTFLKIYSPKLLSVGTRYDDRLVIIKR